MRIRGSDNYRIIDGVRTYYSPDRSSALKKDAVSAKKRDKNKIEQRPDVILLEILNQYAETGKIDISKFFKLKSLSSSYFSIKQTTLEHILHKRNVNANNFFEASYYQILYDNLKLDFAKHNIYYEKANIYYEKANIYYEKANNYKQHLRILYKKCRFLELINNEITIPLPDFNVGNIVNILDYEKRKKINGICYDMNERVHYYRISVNSDFIWVSSVFVDNSKVPLITNSITIPHFPFKCAKYDGKTYQIEGFRYDLIKKKYFYMISVNSKPLWLWSSN